MGIVNKIQNLKGSLLKKYVAKLTLVSEIIVTKYLIVLMEQIFFNMVIKSIG